MSVSLPLPLPLSMSMSMSMVMSVSLSVPVFFGINFPFTSSFLADFETLGGLIT